MKEKLKKYLKILTIELEESLEYLEYLLEVHRFREGKGEITHYVYLENVTILTNELSGIKNFLKIIKLLETDKFQDLESLILYLEKQAVESIEHFDYPEAVHIMCQRKLEKVKRFVLEN